MFEKYLARQDSSWWSDLSPEGFSRELCAEAEAEVRTWLVLRITSPTVERKRSRVSVRTRTVGGGRGVATSVGPSTETRGAGPGAGGLTRPPLRQLLRSRTRGTGRPRPPGPGKVRISGNEMID